MRRSRRSRSHHLNASVEEVAQRPSRHPATVHRGPRPEPGTRRTVPEHGCCIAGARGEEETRKGHGEVAMVGGPPTASGSVDAAEHARVLNNFVVLSDQFAAANEVLSSL